MTRPARVSFCLILSACASTPPGPVSPAVAAREPDYDALVKAAGSYSAAGRAQHAAQTAERAARMSPERPEAYVVWGRSLAQQNQLAEAATRYELARSRKSRDRALFAELASVYDVSKRYHDAIAVYRDYLAASPDDADMQQELGLTLLLVDRPQEAVAALRVAVKNAEGVQPAQDLAFALLRAGEPAEASAVLQGVLEREESPEAWLLLAQARAALGQAPAALDILDRLLARDAAHATALRMRAHLRLLTGSPSGALEDFDRLSQAQGRDAAAALGAAGALVALGRVDEAEARLDAARKLVPDHPAVRFRAAQIAWRRGDKSALARIAQFARANPTHVEAWRELYAAAGKNRDKKLLAEAKARLTALGDAP